MKPKNPFNPKIGVFPRVSGAFEPLMTHFAGTFRGSSIFHSRLLLLGGFAGSGKTTLLDQVEYCARDNRWAVIAENGSCGLEERLAETQVPLVFDAIAEVRNSGRVTGVSIPTLFNNQNNVADSELSSPPEWVTQVRQVLTKLRSYQSGLLITIDDLVASAVGEISNIYPHLSQLALEYENFMVLITVDRIEYLSFINKKEAKFLLDFQFLELPLLEKREVRRVLRKSVEGFGTTWEEDAFAAAVKHCKGYPLLLQYIGYYAWIGAAKHSTITGDHVADAVIRARQDFMRLIVQPVMSTLSDLDLAFLSAMLALKTPAKIARISEYMQRSPDTVAQYRRRLIDRGVIVIVERGWVDFYLPYTADYLREETSAVLPGHPG